MTEQQRDLAEANQGLAWMVASRMHRKEQGEEKRQELGAIALLALCQAAQGFDENRGYTFSTYATQACTQAILDERRSGGLIHTPVYLSHGNARGHRYRVHREHVRDAEYSPGLLGEIAAKVPGPLQRAEMSELRDTIRRKLPWHLCYALERAMEGQTNVEIGRSMGCTKQHASNLVQAARTRLRTLMRRYRA